MKRDKLDQWAHEHAEDIEIMYWELGLLSMSDVVAEGVRRAALRKRALSYNKLIRSISHPQSP